MIKYQGIYKIRNLLNGKVYIGQSVDLSSRFRKHKAEVKREKKHPLYTSMQKYGIENFEFVILEWIEDVTLLNEREQYWMDFYKSYDRTFGYNVLTKAESCKGAILSKGHIEKIRNAIIKIWKDPIYRQKIIESQKERKQSDESKLKIGLAHKGKIVSEETRKKLSLANKGQVPWNKGLKIFDKI